MDFSRRGVVIKQHQIKSMSKRMTTKFRISVFRFVLVCIVFFAITGCFIVAGAVKGLVDNAPDISNLSIAPEGYTSYIYYSDGTVSETLIGSQANRVLVTIDEIPLKVQQCFIVIEDERFYEHDGIDMKSIFRAVASVLSAKNLKFGGSTITQQVLKNRVFGGGNEEDNYDRIARKIQEQFLAIKLEDQYSKDEILEAYINEINFSNQSFGIQVAAQNYFGKDVGELTMSEAAVLAPIAWSPTLLNPIRHPEDNAKRRMACLDNMLKLGFCTEEEYIEAVNDNVYERIAEYAKYKEPTDSTSYSYYTDTVIKQVMNDLQEQLGLTALQAEDLVYRGGIHIYTPQDKEIQEIVDKHYTNEENFPEVGKGSYYELTASYAISVSREDGSVDHYHYNDLLEYFSDYSDSEGKYYHSNGSKKGISQYCIDKEDLIEKLMEFEEYVAPNAPEKEKVLKFFKEYDELITLQPQSSMTIIDQSTGYVAAVYGGRGEKYGKRGLNRAYDSFRQVGSTFKVLASFLPALDSAGLTLATVADDSEYYFPKATSHVRNWWTNGYRGLHSIRTGIYNSMNIVACRIIEMVTPQVSFSYLKNFGFSSLVESMTAENGDVYTDIGPALALGGLTKGVTSVELTAAYASIANEGVYNEPVFYTKVLDKDGKPLLSNIKTAGNQIFKSSTAYLITDAMLDTTKIGTGSRLRFKEYNMPVAGKTGTSTSDYDLWFVGYTPYYTAGIWTGYDNNFKQTNKTYHQDIWRNIMEEIHVTKELQYKSFEKPDSIVEATICTKCGNLAVAGLCDKAEMPVDVSPASPTASVKTEIFAKGTIPTQKCTCHQIFLRCKVSKQLAGPNCPAEDTEEYVYLIKDEVMITSDTPFVHPKGENAYCSVHSHGDNIAIPNEHQDDNNDDLWDVPTDNVNDIDIDEDNVTAQP